MTSSRKRLLTRITLAVIALIVTLTIAWLIVRERLVASMGYVLTDEFSQMPADDIELITWLKEQPGIVAKHAVQVDRDGNALRIDFTQVRSLAGRPPLPALDERVKQLGYLGGRGFRDVR